MSLIGCIHLRGDPHIPKAAVLVKICDRLDVSFDKHLAISPMAKPEKAAFQKEHALTKVLGRKELVTSNFDSDQFIGASQINGVFDHAQIRVRCQLFVSYMRFEISFGLEVVPQILTACI